MSMAAEVALEQRHLPLRMRASFSLVGRGDKERRNGQQGPRECNLLVMLPGLCQ
jgi:hypothetical protein